jgi:5-methyltetrahydrofolate--homocysteine methyltransferase
VVSSLLSENRDAYIAEIKAEYAQLREDHLNRTKDRAFASIAEARANKYKVDWAAKQPVKPSFIGTKVFDNYPLSEIVPYIDWTPFFHTWELKRQYPKILDDPELGTEARKLFADAQEMLQQIVDEQLLEARAVVGFYPANVVEDDTIEVYADEARDKVITEFHTLRQQGKKGDKVPNMAFSDFLAPKETGIADYIGGFVVSAGFGIEKMLEAFAAEHDDYRSIMVKALADRLAEAFTELMHAKVRKELWGYAPNETLGNDDLIKEKYQGIRPAPGYPGCPDHTEKITLFNLLDAANKTGIILTENLAMYPASSVSGLYFSNPESKYFGLGKIGEDQVADLASRKGMPQEELERWLSPNLNYEPTPVAQQTV